MAHEAMIAGRNIALTATIDGAGWTAEAPVALLREPDGVRARSTAAGVEGAPVVISGVFAGAEVVSFAALYDTNLDQSDRHELVLYADGAKTTVAWTSGPVPVLPPPLDPADLAFEDARKFGGTLTPEDWLSWPRNAYLFPPAVYAAAFEWRLWSVGLLTNGATAGYVEVDHLWLGEGLFFDLQLDSEVEVDTGTTTRREGGRTLPAPGLVTGTATLPLAMVEPALVDRVVSAVMSAGGLTPLAWIPDRDDPVASFFYGFLGRALKAARRWSASGWADGAINLERW